MCVVALNLNSSRISIDSRTPLFLGCGLKEEYIKELEKLLPEEKEGDYYNILFGIAFCRIKSEDRFSKIQDDLIIWWIDKAAEEESLPEDNEDSVSSGAAGNMSKLVGSTHLFFQIQNDPIEDELRYGCWYGRNRKNLTLLHQVLFLNKEESWELVQVPILDKEESWDLLFLKIFDEK